MHTSFDHPTMLTGEIVGFQEERDVASGLSSDWGIVIGGQCEDKSGPAAVGSDNDPAPSGFERFVLANDESECIREEAQRMVDVADEIGDILQIEHARAYLFSGNYAGGVRYAAGGE